MLLDVADQRGEADTARMQNHTAERSDCSAEEPNQTASLRTRLEYGSAHALQHVSHAETRLRCQGRKFTNIGDSAQQHGVVGLDAAERAGDSSRLHFL